MKRDASILIGLLWCVAILAVVVVSILRSGTLDLRVAKNHGDRIQAHYLALAAVEKAKALLYLEARQREEEDLNHSGEFYNDPAQFRDIELGRGVFRVIRQGTAEEGGGIVYGVSDEESRLNINHASTEMMEKLPRFQSENAAAIVDYRDEDSNVTQGGAESEEYAAMQPPYLPHNGLLRTDREMLLVRGIQRDSFVGEDMNLNGLLDPEENDRDASFPPDNGDGRLDAGWSGHITVNSGVREVDAKGGSRVNIQEGSENELSQIEGIDANLASAIVQYRGENELNSLGDLLDVRRMEQRGDGNNQGGPTQNVSFPPGAFPPGFQPPGQSGRGGGGGNSRPTGPTLINAQLLTRIADRLKTRGETSHLGAININTAPAAVLECIPGIDERLASDIIRHRSSSGYFRNIAELLNVSGVNNEIFKQIAPHVTARSETFRILGEGEIPSTGARKRIQAIVRIGSGSVMTLAYREDL